MKKIFLTSLVGLFMITGCSQIKGSFDPVKIAKYSNEISVVTKYVVRLSLKKQNLTKEQLVQIKYYLVLCQQTIDLNRVVIFADINTLIDNKVQDPQIKSFVKSVLSNVERYVNSYQLSTRGEAVKKITQAALGGALSAIDELSEI